MALTFKIPDLPAGLVPGNNLISAPALRTPARVNFRRGANLSVIAKEVLDYPRVEVAAAVGAGKSSLLPAELARESKRLVVYVTANSLLALSAFNYAQKVSVDDPRYVLRHRYAAGMWKTMPNTGVLYCGANEYVSMLINAEVAGARLLPHVVFLDESHKCDAWTYVTSHLALELGATNLVLASATFEPDSNIMRETDGKVTEQEYEFGGDACAWDLEQYRKPWSASLVSDSIVVFTDSRQESAVLMRGYRNLGFSVFRLEAGMPEVDFLDAMAAMNDKRSAVAALIADSSFRDGFTFTASRCVDTGRIGYYRYVPGSVERVYRPMYNLERIQTAGRFARVGKQGAVYARPKQEYANRICDLAPVEMEVAAYVYRLLGFQPVGSLAEAVMATAVLPDVNDFRVAANAMYPLQHYVRGSDGRSRTPPAYTPLPEPSGLLGSTHASGEKMQRSDSRESAQSATSQDSSFSKGSAASVSVSSMRSRSRPSEHGSTTVAGTVLSSFEQMMEKRLDRQFKPGDWRVGDYCHVPTLRDKSVSMARFPEKAASLDTYFSPDLDAKRLLSAVMKYSPEFRDDALRLAVIEYNASNAKIRAYENVLRRLDKEGLVLSSYSAQRELARMAKSFQSTNADRDVMAIRIGVLTDGRHELRYFSDAVDSEKQLTLKYYERIKWKLGSQDCPYDPMKRVDGHVERWKDDKRVSRRRRLPQYTSVEVHDDWRVIERRAPGWCGLSRVTEYVDDDGVQETRIETNAVGRILSGTAEIHLTRDSARRVSSSGQVSVISRI